MWYESLDGLKSDELYPNLPDISGLWNKSTRTAGLSPDLLRNYYLTQQIRPRNAPIDGVPADYAVKNLQRSMEHYSPESLRQLTEMSGANNHRDVPRELIEDWNMAGNQVPQNIAFQFAANDVFGLGASVDHFKSHPAYRGAIECYKKFGKAMREFIESQYNLTQDAFRQNGIISLPLYRGMHVSPSQIGSLYSKFRDQYDELSHGESRLHENIPIHTMQPLGSHSQNPSMAARFMSGNRLSDKDQRHMGMITRTDTPVDRILSTSHSGFGVPDESECVVLHSNGLYGNVITVPYGDIPVNSVYEKYAQPAQKAIQPWLDDTDRDIGMLPGRK